METFKVEIDVQSYLTIVEGRKVYQKGKTWDFAAGRGLSVAQITEAVEEQFRWSTDQRMTIWYGSGDGTSVPLIAQSEIAELFDRCNESRIVRFGVTIEKKTNEPAHVRRWQICGKPCTHALHFIFSKGEKVDQYVDDCFSVAKFKAAYEPILMPIRGQSQWPNAQPDFEMIPPKLSRSAGRPRTRRYKYRSEGGNGRKHVCKKCGATGHLKKTCKEPDKDSDADRDATPSPKRHKAAATTTSAPPCTPTKQGIQVGFATSSPVTRSMAAAIAKASSPPSASTRSKMTTDSPLKQV